MGSESGLDKGAVKLENRWRLFFLVPLTAYLFPHLFLLTGGYESYIMPTPREYGYVENGTALFFLLAGCYAFYLATITGKGLNILRFGLIFVGLTAIWVAMEEISYGQHFFSYDPPDWFLKHNKNKEFNLHNLGNDAPSYALKTIGYIVVSFAGIIAPLFAAYTKIALPAFLEIAIPSVPMVIPSLFHLFANLPKNIIRAFPGGDDYVHSTYYFSESGEYEEYMLGIWAIMFLVSFHRSLNNRTHP